MTAQIIDCRWIADAARDDRKPAEARNAEIKAFPWEATVRLPAEFLSLHRIARLTPYPALFARNIAADTRLRGHYARMTAEAAREHVARADLWERYAAMIEAQIPAAFVARRTPKLTNTLIA